MTQIKELVLTDSIQASEEVKKIKEIERQNLKEMDERQPKEEQEKIDQS